MSSSPQPIGFQKGDSNRCRNAYERVLHDKLSSAVLAPQKKNKHISVGRCRKLAIIHGIALPRYEDLQQVGFTNPLRLIGVEPEALQDLGSALAFNTEERSFFVKET